MVTSERDDALADHRRPLPARFRGWFTRRRTFVIAALVTWSVGVLALGALVGYELFNRYAVHANGPVVLRSGAQTTGQGANETATAPFVMPDVEGLTKAQALQAIADSGFDPSKVKIT